MLKRLSVLVALAIFASAWNWGAVSLAGDAPSETAQAARLDVYQPEASKPGSFALSLSPNFTLPKSRGHEVVVLFDTSASQTGPFRAKALDTLTAWLSAIKPTTSVKLIAVDLEPHALCEQFAVGDSEAIAKAIATLKARAPLGATDMIAALDAACDSFKTNSDLERSVVYIGDGLSGARFVIADELKQLIERLVEKRIAVSSYAIGPSVDATMLASIANQTGGSIAVDGERTTAKQVAAYLAGVAQGVVVWPTATKLPREFASVFPSVMPPLRSDRDTIVVGSLDKNTKAGASLAMTLRGKACGETVKLEWNVAVGKSNDDFAFLTALVDSAKANGGIGLTTVGTPGLMEARRTINASVAQLAQLGSQAVATGNLDSAQRFTDEALRRDPNDPAARLLKKQLAKERAASTSAVATKSTAPSAESPVRALPTSVSVKKTDKGVLKLEKFRNDQAPPPSDVAGEELPADEAAMPVDPDADGGFLGTIEEQNRVIRELISVEVENAIRDARNRMATDPDGVGQNLKLELDRVLRSPELNSELRAQLRDQLETSIREASRQGTIKTEIDQQVNAARATREERIRVIQSLDRKQEKIAQLMDRYDALMDEGRYLLAEETATEVAVLAPNSSFPVNAVLTARQTRYQTETMVTRILRQKGVVDSLRQVEMAHIPFADDEPIIYPAADVWEELTIRRKKYAAVDLKKVGGAEERIANALEEPTSLEFVETPLSDVVDYLKDRHSIEIQLDTKALEDAGAGSDTPITRNLKGITLRSALRLMLGGLDLTYVIKDEVLLITTPEKAGSELVTKVYPVADLVLPIQQTGFSGGFGGLGGGSGGVGGMNGGGQGGMGNFGGGGGGMGGGMGGGGGGGGFFSVPDDVPQAKKLAKQATVAPTKAKVTKVKPAAAIELNVAANADLNQAWRDYFAQHNDVSDAEIRETARQTMKAKKASSTIAMIQAALAAGYAQPWMYEALGLALLASGGDKADTERALMSAVDFADSTDEMLYAAQYMARNGLEKRALTVFRQVSLIEPLRPEPLQFGLQLAVRTEDLEGQKWASLGVLKQAWPNKQREIRDTANRVALSVIEQLKSEKRTKEAADFEAALAQALVRDAWVKVTWTGDADVDVSVEEPAGTVCSFRNPRTTGGGVMLGDAAARGAATSKDGISESYVCPEAYSGTYKMLLRRVWGKVTAGKVTVDVYTNYGTKQMHHERQQIPLGEQDALVVFDVAKGRRNAPAEEQLVAQAAADQFAVNRAILAQQIGGAANSAAGMNFALSRAGLDGQIPFLRGGVGFQPVIITLPSGANFTATGVISADRRYVRITALPLFSQIGQVTTFNIATGNSRTSPAPPQGNGSGIGTNPIPGGNGGGGGGGGGGNNGGVNNPNPGADPGAGNPL